MDSKFIAAGVVGALIIAGGSFYAGMQYAQSQRGARLAAGGNSQFFQAGTGGRQGGRFAGGGAAFGTILSKDAEGITIELTAPGQASSTQSTGSKIILVNGSTQINKTASGSADDLSVGENVTIQGTQNSDGSITAQMIQVRPAGMGFRGQ